MLRLLSIGIIALALAGCQSLAEVATSPASVPLSTQKMDARLGEVTVVVAAQDERQGYIRPEVNALTPMWRSGVIDALTQSQTFTPSATQTFNVRVKIIRLDQIRNADLGITSTAIASYEVINPLTQELVWIRGISTSGTASYQEAIMQSSRERIALSRSLQANILQFVQLLGQGSAPLESVPERPLRFQP